MRDLVILGAGTSGTMMANHLAKKLPKNEWNITIIDQYKTHYYQPGFLFLPFDIYTSKQVKKKGKKFIPKAINYIQKKIELIQPEKNKVVLEDGKELDYDILIYRFQERWPPFQQRQYHKFSFCCKHLHF